MKKLSLFLVALSVSIMCSAQSGLIATLSHDGEISSFYGIKALSDAHEAASHGDIITLSSGSFLPTDITKAVTIRGAGMQVDTIAKISPTVIEGDFTINIPDSIKESLTIEGIYNGYSIKVNGELKNAKFLKDRLSSITYINDSVKMKNLSFVHCKVFGCLYLPKNSSASCVNSFINDPRTTDNNKTGINNFEFTNCVVFIKDDTSSSPYKIYLSSFVNCFIFDLNYLHSSNTAFYCVGQRNNGGNIFANLITPSLTNSTVSVSTASILKDGIKAEDSNTFVLSETGKKYLGSDGTEVGMYGGSLPFEPTPTNPQITKCTVSPKSTADGKLSVEIEVSSAK